MIPHKKHELQPPKTSQAIERLMDAAVAIRQSPEDAERYYMARQLVQCTLPHSDPGKVPVWKRTNGSLTLKIRPHLDENDQPQYPYGTIPRLLLFWLVTEATQKKTRRLCLGQNVSSFMREVGLNPRGGGGPRGDAMRLRSQMERLFRSTISFEDRREEGIRWQDMQVGPKGELWWNPARPKQDALWESWVELGEDFYNAITSAPVPIDLRALRALKRSPLALDLYAWLAHTAFAANRQRQARIIPWEGLHGQMGAEYKHLRQFRANVLLSIRKIRTVYLGLNLELTPETLIVRPSPTPISSKS